MRIAHWVQGIFLALRSAIDDNARIVSSTNLATAMMLASLEIISPKAFGVAVPWQKHLNFARDLMRKHFPALRQMHSSSHEDRVCSFLWSWFAYLDVLGSLSGGPRQSGTPVLLPMDQHDDLDEIDCIMGFTTRCLHLLSKTADLVRSSDAMRILPDHSVDPSWQPPPSTMREAESLDAALRESLSRQPLPCAHIPQEPSGRNTVEMTATNEAFHWAALVQLHRRALGKPASDPDVMGPVQRVMGCLAQIRSGAAEMGMLFPMFTAGCEVVDEESRKEVLGRFVNMERNGMTQVRLPLSIVFSSYPPPIHIRHLPSAPLPQTVAPSFDSRPTPEPLFKPDILPPPISAAPFISYADENRSEAQGNSWRMFGERGGRGKQCSRTNSSDEGSSAGFSSAVHSWVLFFQNCSSKFSFRRTSRRSSNPQHPLYNEENWRKRWHYRINPRISIRYSSRYPTYSEQYRRFSKSSSPSPPPARWRSCSPAMAAARFPWRCPRSRHQT